MVSDYFLLECITSTDCPNGGINFKCNGNKCECPSPNVLQGDKCVGMFPFDMAILNHDDNLKSKVYIITILRIN